MQITPELFDTLILVNLIIGAALAIVWFYRDMRRRPYNPLPSDRRIAAALDDTQPHDPNTPDDQT